MTKTRNNKLIDRVAALTAEARHTDAIALLRPAQGDPVARGWLALNLHGLGLQAWKARQVSAAISSFIEAALTDPAPSAYRHTLMSFLGGLRLIGTGHANGWAQLETADVVEATCICLQWTDAPSVRFQRFAVELLSLAPDLSPLFIALRDGTEDAAALALDPKIVAGEHGRLLQAILLKVPQLSTELTRLVGLADHLKGNGPLGDWLENARELALYSGVFLEKVPRNI